jgi:hypothetical protein
MRVPQCRTLSFLHHHRLGLYTPNVLMGIYRNRLCPKGTLLQGVYPGVRSLHVYHPTYPTDMETMWVDASRAPADYDHSAVVYSNVITPEQEADLVAHLSGLMKRCVHMAFCCFIALR